MNILTNVGVVTLSRASHVEPGAVLTPEQVARLDSQVGNELPAPSSNPDFLQQWFADMAPSNGPVLGPYTSRDEALAAEINWINTNILQVNDHDN